MSERRRDGRRRTDGDVARLVRLAVVLVLLNIVQLLAAATDLAELAR